MKKVLLGLSIIVMAIGSVQAQDIHRTQYWASPLTLNPALTGLVQGDLRLTANFRSQWYSVSSHPYQTGIVSYDMATLKGKLNNGDAVGVGILGTYDKSGVGSLQNINVGLSVAYHKTFGIEKQNTFSIGAQGLLVQKSIDFNALQFESQFDPATGYNQAIGHGEQFDNKDLTYPDFNVGLMYSGRVSTHATAYAGASMYHMTQPVETFLNSDYKIHSRYSAYLGGSFDLNENMVLYASGLYQSQASATEVMLGAAAGFILNPGQYIPVLLILHQSLLPIYALPGSAA